MDELSILMIFFIDIIDFSVATSSQNIVQNVTSFYRHGDLENRLTHSESSQFVTDVNGSTKDKTVNLYLYNTDEATEVTQRELFYNELSTSIINLKAKMSFTTSSLNDVVGLQLDRLYQRFGSSDNIKLGSIIELSKDGSSTKVTIADLSNMFSRVATYTDDAAAIFTASTDIERSKSGYFTNNDGLVDNNEETYGINVLG